MFDLAFFVGAFVGAFLLSRLFWVLSWWWTTNFPKAVVLNLISGLTAVAIAGFGAADGGEPKFADNAPVYLGAQVLVLFIDLWRLRSINASVPQYYEGGTPLNRFTEQPRRTFDEIEPNAMNQADAHQLKRKGHRLGIFITVASVLLTLASLPAATGYSAPAWASAIFAAGLVGIFFGYLMARLWYWFKAA